jgi:hypothetical protein
VLINFFFKSLFISMFSPLFLGALDLLWIPSLDSRITGWWLVLCRGQGRVDRSLHLRQQEVSKARKAEQIELLLEGSMKGGG